MQTLTIGGRYRFRALRSLGITSTKAHLKN